MLYETTFRYDTVQDMFVYCLIKIRPVFIFSITFSHFSLTRIIDEYNIYSFTFNRDTSFFTICINRCNRKKMYDVSVMPIMSVTRLTVINGFSTFHISVSNARELSPRANRKTSRHPIHQKVKFHSERQIVVRLPRDPINETKRIKARMKKLPTHRRQLCNIVRVNYHPSNPKFSY